MSLALYAHPFSSYCQKVLIALYENDTPFTFHMLSDKNPDAVEKLRQLWPLKRFPVLVDGSRTVIEASIIVEYLGLHHPGGVSLVPADPKAALEVRFLDRFFDNYIMTPQQKLVFDALRREDQRDAYGVAEAKKLLKTAYGWLNDHMADREWAAGADFSLADCAAGPSLFYADWSHEIGAEFPNVRAYRDRLNARPSFARAIDEARSFRHFFPLGAPDRD